MGIERLSSMLVVIRGVNDDEISICVDMVYSNTRCMCASSSYADWRNDGWAQKKLAPSRESKKPLNIIISYSSQDELRAAGGSLYQAAGSQRNNRLY
jgi:hypothetical protein